MYCAGHLIQATVTRHRATAQTTLLTIAGRLADLLRAVFGPAEAGKRPGVDGHPEVELALVEFARATGERGYLDLARYFLGARGHGLAGGDAYRQDHCSFVDLDALVDHAVRAVYLCARAADVYSQTGEAALRGTLAQLWLGMVTRHLYVTGGIGARHDGEAFGADYELPNARAYAETCAAIRSVLWSWRMLLITGAARYADLLEHTLYNAVLPGIGLEGRSYFYENPLAEDGTHRRQPWFDCACCPPNVARLLAALPGYVVTVADDGLWLHLYAAGRLDAWLPDGRRVRLRLETRYPWDGEVGLEVDAAGLLTLFLRAPGWCEGAAALTVNGEPVPEPVAPGSYAAVRRAWRRGDVVRLRLPMPAR